MRKRPMWIAVCLAWAATSFAPQPSEAGPGADEASPPVEVTPASLGARIDELLMAEVLVEAKVSIHVYDLETQKTLYSRGPKLALNPASNVKLLTTAAALALLGPDHRYPTRVYVAKGELGADGTVSGDLYLQGGGDPSLVTGDLFELAHRVRAAGVTRVKGRVVVDAGRFDGDGLPPGFDQKDEFAAYRAPFGATAVNFDTYVVRAAKGGKAGDPLVARVVPPVDTIKIDNQATLVEGRKNSLAVTVIENKGKTTVKIRGTLGVDASRPTWRYPVADPSAYAGEVFRLVLRQAGVKVDKRGVGKKAVPARAELIETHRSQPLSVLVRAVNKFSNNFMAEQILRTLDEGEGASASDSLARLRSHAAAMGMGDDLVLGNGSGLYDNNRISAEAMTTLLAAVYADFRIRADFLASLAVMGVDGTTRRRLDEDPARGWVRAKTGTLDGVSALSGYAGTRGRRPVAFSIFFNELPRYRVQAAREVQDGIVSAIVDSIDGPGRPATERLPESEAADEDEGEG